MRKGEIKSLVLNEIKNSNGITTAEISYNIYGESTRQHERYINLLLLNMVHNNEIYRTRNDKGSGRSYTYYIASNDNTHDNIILGNRQPASYDVTCCDLCHAVKLSSDINTDGHCPTCADLISQDVPSVPESGISLSGCRKTDKIFKCDTSSTIEKLRSDPKYKHTDKQVRDPTSTTLRTIKEYHPDNKLNDSPNMQSHDSISKQVINIGSLVSSNPSGPIRNMDHNNYVIRKEISNTSNIMPTVITDNNAKHTDINISPKSEMIERFIGKFVKIALEGIQKWTPHGTILSVQDNMFSIKSSEGEIGYFSVSKVVGIQEWNLSYKERRHDTSSRYDDMQSSSFGRFG